MDRPRIHRSRDRVCIPKLSLQQQATRSIEATGILNVGCLTAQLWVGANGMSISSACHRPWKQQGQLGIGEGDHCH